MPGGRRLGGLSLMAMAGGFLATRLIESAGWLPDGALTLPRAGFEAGMVGGLADWYAVTVLFRRAPLPLRWIPLFDKHSRLLVKNRARISENIVHLVEHEWLTPEAIRSQLENKSLVEGLCQGLLEEKNRQQLIESLAQAIASQTNVMESPAVVGFLDKLLREQLAGADLARPIGAWMEQTIISGRHEALWQTLTLTLDNLLNDPKTHDYLDHVLADSLREYAARDWLKYAAVLLGETTGAIDRRKLVHAALASAREKIALTREDPATPMRQRIDAYLLQLARELQTPDTQAARRFDEFRLRLARNADLTPVIGRIIQQAAETLQSDLRNPSGQLRQVLSHLLDNAIAHLRGHPEQRDRLDELLRDAAVAFVTRNRALIGGAVRLSLSPERLSDQMLIDQIEPKVADDLAYIRLNGAVVGFLVGVALALINILMARF